MVLSHLQSRGTYLYGPGSLPLEAVLWHAYNSLAPGRDSNTRDDWTDSAAFKFQKPPISTGAGKEDLVLASRGCCALELLPRTLLEDLSNPTSAPSQEAQNVLKGPGKSESPDQKLTLAMNDFSEKCKGKRTPIDSETSKKPHLAVLCCAHWRSLKLIRCTYLAEFRRRVGIVRAGTSPFNADGWSSGRAGLANREPKKIRTLKHFVLNGKSKLIQSQFPINGRWFMPSIGGLFLWVYHSETFKKHTILVAQSDCETISMVNGLENISVAAMWFCAQLRLPKPHLDVHPQ